MVPSGFPTARNWSDDEEMWVRVLAGFAGSAGCKVLALVLALLLFRRKSWVIAMPIEAKAREVRSQARKVRSSIDQFSLSST